ncbi:MAG: NTP transferase domain-containing protein [Deltaproteobacteria bacterium]|nr:NTP transferase domain-containing protein [Kofleriaceae bacterium]
MTMARNGGRTWAIVLAGGDGTRLAALTEAVHGRPVPKQFATVTGDRSMVQATLDRVARIVPPERTVIVIGRAHLAWARAQLGAYTATTLVQPASRGTATAILYALTWIRLRERDANVLVFPSDHHVENVTRFVEAVRIADEAARALGKLTVVGVSPEAGDPDYGWIVAGAPVAPACCSLECFVEKPGAEVALRLHACGGLWNTFILAAPASLVAELARRHLPEHARRFDALDRFAFAPGAPDLDELYAAIEPADFSKHVLETARDLLVVSMEGTGWSDWGTPERVLASLQGTPAETLLRARLDAAVRRMRAPASRRNGPRAGPARALQNRLAR